MPVQAASLEILEKANVPAPQARAIVQAIEIEMAGARETLATKQDILILRHEMAEMRAELKTEIATLRGDLRSEIHAMRGDLRSEMHAIASGNLRQMHGAMLGQLAVLLGEAYFVVSHVAHECTPANQASHELRPIAVCQGD